MLKWLQQVGPGHSSRSGASRSWRYGIAVLSVAVAVAVRLALDSVIAPGHVLMFTLAAMAAARIGGRGPGLFASALSLPAAWYFFIPPRFSFGLPSRTDIGSLVALAAAGVGFSLLFGAPQQAARVEREPAVDRSFYRRVALFGAAFLLLGVLTRLLYDDFERGKDRVHWVAHSYQVLNEIRGLRSILRDAETQEQGYLLTGDESYREPFELALREEHSVRQSLRLLTADSRTQQKRLDTVDRLVETLSSEFQTAMARRRSEGLAALIASVRTGAAKRSMDECRAALAGMEEEDRNLLIARTDAAEVQGRRMRWLLGLGSGSLLALLVIASVVIERDSRNRKRAAEASRQANERFRRFVDSNIIGVVVATPSGSLIEANDYYLRLVGYTREEFEHGLVDWRAITPPEWIPADERSIGELRQLGKSASYEKEYLRRDGTRVTVLLSDAMLPGNEEHIAAFVLDITARKKAEEALRESEERFRIMADGCPTIIWASDAEGGTRFVNRAYREFFGVTYEQAEGNQWQPFVHPDDLQAYVGAFLRAVKERAPFRAEARVRRADGEWRWIASSAEPRRAPAGEYLGHVGISPDITERKVGEDALHDSMEQLRALAARVERIREEERMRVAREIHDELGQALTGIKMDVSALIHSAAPNRQARIKRYRAITNLIDEAIQSVRRIATDLRPGMLDDLGLVTAVEWAAEGFAARTSTKCNLDLPADDFAVQPEVATALFRIFQEALTNIARHAEATEFVVRLAEDNGGVRLEVRDNGQGLPGGQIAPGVSLGILGMQERALLLGGRLTVGSEPGSGVTVSAWMPARKRGGERRD